MSSGVTRRWVFTFAHRARVVELGPYEDEQEAREAFQRVYGYWPADVIAAELWVPERVA